MPRCVKCGQLLSGEEKECPCCGIVLGGAQDSMIKDQSESAHGKSAFSKVAPEKKQTDRKPNPAGLIMILIIIAGAAYYFFRPDYADFQQARGVAVKYLECIDEMNIQCIKELTCAEERQNYETVAGYGQDIIKMINGLQPPQARITGIEKSGEGLLLSLVSDDAEYAGAAGIMRLVREYDAWKVKKIDWKIRIGNAAVYGGAKTLKLRSFIPAPGVKKLEEALNQDADFLPLFGDMEYRIEGRKPEIAKEFTEFEYPVFVFSPAGNYLLAAGYGNYLAKLFYVSGWNTAAECTMKRRPVSAAYCEDSFVLADAYGNFTAAIPEGGWKFKDVASGGGTQPKIYGSPNRKYMVSVSFDKKMAVYEAKTFRLVAENTSFMPPLTCGAFWPQGPYFFAGTNTRKFIIWDLGTGGGRTYRVSKVTESMVTSVSFSPDGKYFVTTHNDSSIVLFETETQKEIRNYYVRDKSTFCSDFSSDGKYFATGHDKGWVYIWTVPDAKQAGAYKLHDDMVLGIKFVPGANRLATSGNDHKIRIWNFN